MTSKSTKSCKHLCVLSHSTRTRLVRVTRKTSCSNLLLPSPEPRVTKESHSASGIRRLSPPTTSYNVSPRAVKSTVLTEQGVHGNWTPVPRMQYSQVYRLRRPVPPQFCVTGVAITPLERPPFQPPSTICESVEAKPMLSTEKPKRKKLHRSTKRHKSNPCCVQTDLKTADLGMEGDLPFPIFAVGPIKPSPGQPTQFCFESEQAKTNLTAEKCALMQQYLSSCRVAVARHVTPQRKRVTFEQRVTFCEPQVFDDYSF